MYLERLRRSGLNRKHNDAMGLVFSISDKIVDHYLPGCIFEVSVDWIFNCQSQYLYFTPFGSRVRPERPELGVDRA